MGIARHLGGNKSWTGQTAPKTVAGAAEKEAAAGQASSAAETRGEKAAAGEALKAATAEREAVENARKRQVDDATVDLRPETLAHPAHKRTAAAGKAPLRNNVNKTAAERGSSRSTNEGKADGDGFHSSRDDDGKGRFSRTAEHRGDGYGRRRLPWPAPHHRGGGRAIGGNHRHPRHSGTSGTHGRVDTAPAW